MSYDKNTWQTGDVVTSEKLNHMEQGIESASGGGVFVVSASLDSEVGGYILSETWQTIYNAMDSGQVVFIKMDAAAHSGTNICTYEMVSNAVFADKYYLDTVLCDEGTVQGHSYVADTATDYPVYTDG